MEFTGPKRHISSLVKKMQNILDAIVNNGGNPLFVGGCVRDELLNIQSKDIDVEVYGLDANKLIQVLEQFGKVDQVGVSFGVIKLTTETDDYDFTLPRIDNKVGVGHTGFEVIVDHTLTPYEAAARRDFSINAIGKDVNGNLIDPYNGQMDLQNRVLRATSSHFAEDPLRVLRGFQFAGRFNMKVESETSVLCQQLMSEYNTLASERIFGEWEKWALKSTKPSAGLKYLVDTGWIKLYPELDAICDLDQDPEWHPEGCVLTHTGLVCDAAAEIATRDQLCDEERLVLIFGGLCHDLGKATTTHVSNGRIVAPGHAEAGIEPTISLMNRIGFVGDNKLKKVVDQVVKLVAEHMAHINIEPNPRIVRRLAVRTNPSNLNQLVRLIEADHSGRHPLPKCCPENALQILTIAKQLEIEASVPKPIVMGRHLIEHFNMTPGPEFKLVLDRCYQAQLDGKFDNIESGLLFVTSEN